MSDLLRDPLHDLLAEVPSYVRVDPRDAWEAGTRRRTRRRVRVAGLVVVLAMLAAAGVAAFPRSTDLPPAGGQRGGATGYPTRIEKPWWTGDLPARPGPIAGVVARVQRHDTYDEPLGWYAVSQTGRLWQLPGSRNDYTPAVSPDGTRLAYLDARPGRGLVLADLVTGERTSGDVGAPENRTRYPWELGLQSPSFWSPDSSRLLLPAYVVPEDRGTGEQALVLDGRGTTTVPVPTAGGAVMPVGWASNSSLAWLTWHPGENARADAARVLVTDDRGHLLRAVRLDSAGGTGDFNQWTGLVSPDGRTLVVRVPSSGDGAGIRVYNLATGHLRTSANRVPHAESTCLPAWSDRSLQVPTTESPQDATLVSVDGGVTIRADPRLAIRCSLWATDALDGQAHAGFGARVFGDSTSWLSWHWREAAAGLVGLVLLGWVVGVAVRRRRVSG